MTRFRRRLALCVVAVSASVFLWLWSRLDESPEEEVDSRVVVCDAALGLETYDLPLSNPEERFMQQVIDEFHHRHEQTGAYPKTWDDLSGPGAKHPDGFGKESFPESVLLDRTGKRGEDPAFWFHTYEIVHVSDRDFNVLAKDAKGRVTWDVHAHDERPEKVDSMLCHLEDEVRLDPEREAPHFLEHARRRVRNHYAYRQFLPEVWSELYIHYALDEHVRETEPHEGALATPPPGTGARWRPRGSRFTYVLENDGCTLRIRSENERGLQDWVVEGPTSPPRMIEEGGA